MRIIKNKKIKNSKIYSFRYYYDFFLVYSLYVDYFYLYVVIYNLRPISKQSGMEVGISNSLFRVKNCFIDFFHSHARHPGVVFHLPVISDVSDAFPLS